MKRTSCLHASSSYLITPVPYPVFGSFVTILQVMVCANGPIAPTKDVLHRLIRVTARAFTCCCKPPSVKVPSCPSHFTSGTVKGYPFFSGQLSSTGKFLYRILNGVTGVAVPFIPVAEEVTR